MSASDHLHPEQFKGYKPAKEESHEAQEWLASDEGHRWQNIQFDKTQFGFFTLKPNGNGYNPEWGSSFESYTEAGHIKGGASDWDVNSAERRNGYSSAFRKLYERD